MASKFGMLGSIDCNTGDPMLGWDTDCFLMDHKKVKREIETAVKASKQ